MRWFREDHAASRRLQSRRDFHRDGFIHVTVAVLDDDHRAVVEIGDTLPRLLPLEEGHIFDLGGGRKVEVIHTPGHTPGSVTLLCAQGDEQVYFTGDTLFRDSCGRTDFPGSSTEDMLRSLKRLAELPGSGEVYPGHGFSTTLERERSMNYFMKGAVRGAML